MIAGDEDVGPAHLVVVHQVLPVGIPGGDMGCRMLVRLALQGRLQVENPQRRVLILGLGDDVATVGRRRERVAIR